MSEETTPPGDPVAEEIVRLYGLPPEEFVAARNAAAKALRQEQRREDAARLADLRRPSLVESAVNRTARRDPETTAAWAAAARAADAAQSATIGGGDAVALRAAVKDLRAATGAMVDATVTTIGDPTRRDDVAALLREVPAAAVDQVLTGVLGSAPREADLFAGAPAPPPRPARPTPAPKRTRTPKLPPPAGASPAPVEAAPPPPSRPSRRERTLAAAVERRRTALADAARRRDAARASAIAAQERVERAEGEHTAAESALSEAEAELRAERERRDA